MQTSLMTSHLKKDLSYLSGSSQWMEQSLILDGRIYDTLKSGLLTQNLSEKNADKLAKEEILKSIVSGENTPLVSRSVPEKEAQQFQKINQDRLLVYTLNASAHAHDEFYPTMHVNGAKADNLITKISNRLGVDRSSLLTPTGIDLVNTQKDASGNIISGERISRRTHEDMGKVKCSYDAKNRPVSVTEFNPDNTL